MNSSNQTSDSSDSGGCLLPYEQAMKQLIFVVQKLSLARNLEAIMGIVRVAARQLTKADGATFVLRDRDQCFYADEDAIAPLWKGQRFPMEICIGGWAMQHRKPVVIKDIYEDSRIPIAAYEPTFVKSLTMVPIRTINPMGAIGVYWAKPHQSISEEVELLQALADTTAVALENVQVYTELEQRVQDRTLELEFINAQLQEEVRERQAAEAQIRHLSITDELTKLHNRRGFLLMAEQQIKLAHRMKTSLCLFFMDLDGLKKVNDSLGHEAGDQLIMDAAYVLKQTFRESDVIARFGGDEFVVLVSGSLEGDEVCDRLQKNVNEFNRNSDRPYQVSMSMGFVCCQVQTSTGLEQLLEQADELMYEQKRWKYANRQAAPIIRDN